MYPGGQSSRRQSPRNKGKGSSMKYAPEKVVWSEFAKDTLLELANDEYVGGWDYGTSFTALGWRNLANNMTARLECQYEVSQLKNQWRKIRGEYNKIKHLLFSETGGGLDGRTGLLQYDQQWWASTIARDVTMKKFKGMNLLKYRKLGPTLFKSAGATGEFSTAPSHYSGTILEGGEDTRDSGPDSDEGSGDSGGIVKAMRDTTFSLGRSGGVSGSQSSGKRKRVGPDTSKMSDHAGVRRKLDISRGSSSMDGEPSTGNVPKKQLKECTVEDCLTELVDLQVTDRALYLDTLDLLSDDLSRRLICNIGCRELRNDYIRRTRDTKGPRY